MANNDISGITMNTDWGAKGQRLTGRQVQEFIKYHLNKLQLKVGTNDDDIDELKEQMEEMESWGRDIEENSRNITSLTPTSAEKAVQGFGVMIAYHSEEEAYVDSEGRYSPQCRFASYNQWKRLKTPTGAYTADGVAVFDGNGNPLIIAPSEVTSTRGWDGTDSNHKNIFSHFQFDLNKQQQLIDYNFGLADTVIILREHPASGLAYECNRYKRQYAITKNGNTYQAGFGSGDNANDVSRWWLPSSGEMFLIWRYRDLINLCLSVIPDSTPIADNALYYTSTEKNIYNVIALDFGCGRFVMKAKSTLGVTQYVSRPIIRPQVTWKTDSMDEPVTKS